MTPDTIDLGILFMFVYYQQSELEKLFEDASLKIVKSWGGTTSIGTLGDKRTKQWCHYLLKKSGKQEE